MANVTQLKHLEHIEDEILNHGSAGCMASVSAMQELLRMLGKKPSSGYMQTKCCLLYTSPSPRDSNLSRMPSSA